MMNHSCDANVSASFHGTRMTVRAVRDIPCGGEIGETGEVRELCDVC